ncbi:MAG: carbohydrate-binding protein [Fibrobacterota bacterium]|nr:carbohydrate-binding protein [Fibrobacterota bacterium]
MDTAPQVPPFDSWSDSIEAEGTFLSGPVIGNSFQGYSGTGFVEYQGEKNDFLEWTVNVRDSGDYILEFRYALFDNWARPLEISVDGVVAQAHWAFPGTGGWSSWNTAKMALILPAGEAKIRAKAVGLSGPNVDQLRLVHQ